MDLSSLRLSYRYFALEPSPHWPPNIWTKALVQVVVSQLINVTLERRLKPDESPGARAQDRLCQEPGARGVQVGEVEVSPFIWYLAIVAV